MTSRRTEQADLTIYIILQIKIIDPITKCWFRSERADRTKYQSIKYKNKYEKIHRLSAVAFLNYHLDSELIICHKCDRPACFNPKHLFLGTDRINMLDAIRKGRNTYHRDFISVIEITNYLKSGTLRKLVQ